MLLHAGQCGVEVCTWDHALSLSPTLIVASENVPKRVKVPFGMDAWSSDVCALESDCLRMQSKVGGKLHPRLNTGASPIVNKYREGKLKSTLKRE